jgi:hypothetical protein
LHREWYGRSALADLLGADAALADSHTLYRCHDRLLEHKQALFDYLVRRWRDLFNVSFDVLLCDLTSTYFGAPGEAWRFQRVKFPHRQGGKPPHRESSLGLMEVTT